MSIFNTSSWIWTKESANQDDYASFLVTFNCKTSEAILNISVDSVYAVYLNDRLIRFMGCSDYPYYKFYDSIKLDCSSNQNTLRIDVWHFGVDSQTYYSSEHGLIFEILSNNKVICSSNVNTPSRIINQFENGYKKIITRQLGLSFKYDSTKEDSEYSPSVLINKTVDEYALRNINPIMLLPRKEIEITKLEHSYLIDLKEETVGIPDLEFYSPKKQNIVVAFGEHILDGGVRRRISTRDFSFEYVAKPGQNTFINPLRRIAGRYLEVFFEDDIQINYIGIRPVKYEHSLINKNIEDPYLSKLYSMCIHTLECCMHEHYEDCPWREQALYNLDSRNQMLCGYYAFEGYEYQRHNLLLISKDKMTNGLLSLCFPMKSDELSIPMFSLCYIIQLYEYVKYTDDKTILDDVKDAVYKIVNTFKSKVDSNHLIPYFSKPIWNFYEWTKGSSNGDVFDPNSPKDKSQYDLIINAMYVYVIPMFNELYNENIVIDDVKEEIYKTFFDKKSHLFRMHTNTKKCSQFGQSLVILIGLGDEVTYEKTKKCSDMIEASLSTRGFVYDALLKDGNNKEFILQDIKNRYNNMIDEGATTVYETEGGADDFGGSGSLCHGWSALPIYYLNILGVAK